MFDHPLPPQSVDLIRRLDENIKAPTVRSPERLAQESFRLQLAAEQGARDLVDKLIANHKRHHGGTI